VAELDVGDVGTATLFCRSDADEDDDDDGDGHEDDGQRHGQDNHRSFVFQSAAAAAVEIDPTLLDVRLFVFGVGWGEREVATDDDSQ